MNEWPDLQPGDLVVPGTKLLEVLMPNFRWELARVKSQAALTDWRNAGPVLRLELLICSSPYLRQHEETFSYCQPAGWLQRVTEEQAAYLLLGES